MTARPASDRRSRVQIPPLRRADLHPLQDPRPRHTGALVRSLTQPKPPASPARSSLTIKAATTLSYYAGHALPALLLGFCSWAVAEMLFGFAAYAEAMYSPPAPSGLAPAETKAVDTLRSAKPSLSPMTIQVDAGSAGSGNQSGSAGRAAALPAKWRGTRADRLVLLMQIASAGWASLCRGWDRRRAIEELRSLDDRSLRDIGITRCDIEGIVRHGVRRE